MKRFAAILTAVLLTVTWAMPRMGSATHAAQHVSGGHSNHGLNVADSGHNTSDQAVDDELPSANKGDRSGKCHDQHGAMGACCGAFCNLAGMPAEFERIVFAFETEAPLMGVLVSAVEPSPTLIERPPRASQSFLG